MTPSNQVQDEQINENKRRIEWLETHWSVFNDEMGAVKTDVALIKKDIKDVKEALENAQKDRTSILNWVKWGVGIGVASWAGLGGLLLNHILGK